jgi:hypothetical protein
MNATKIRSEINQRLQQLSLASLLKGLRRTVKNLVLPLTGIVIFLFEK